MNEGFQNLPIERQNQIINAGFRIFAGTPYKKASAAEIAAEAGISKALLFYHFKNKKELYFYLWQKAIELTSQEVRNQEVWETNDYFEMLRRSMIGKCKVLEKHPYAMEFSMRAYYEEDPEIREEILKRFGQVSEESEQKIREAVDLSRIRKDIPFHMIYQEMIWASDGYMRQMLLKGNMDTKQIECDFNEMIAIWKKVYSN